MANDEEEIAAEHAGSPPRSRRGRPGSPELIRGWVERLLIERRSRAPLERHVASAGGFGYAARAPSRCTAGENVPLAVFPCGLASTILFRCFEEE